MTPSPDPRSDNTDGDKRDVPLGDNGKPLVVRLTPEQVKAAEKALDELFRLPNIHRNSTIIDAINALREQRPLLEKKADEEKARRISRRKFLDNVAGWSIVCSAIGAMGYVGYELFRDPDYYARRFEAESFLGGKPSKTSINNYRVYYTEMTSEVSYERKKPQEKPLVLDLRKEILIEEKPTAVKVDEYRLIDGTTTIALILSVSTTGEYQRVFLQNPSKTLDTRVYPTNSGLQLLSG